MTAAGDSGTARAFSQSWNRVGTVYSHEQFLDWFDPITPEQIRGRSVLELGFGNGSLLAHVARCEPSRLSGIELGDTAGQTRRNLAGAPVSVELHRGDLTTADLGPFDLVYCIGVLHHLESPDAGFASVLRHTASGGRFHCWIYAREGNGLVRAVVEPIRRVASRLPWWLTKYGLALPLVTPFFLWARLLRATGLDGARSPLRRMPLFDYTRWIAREPFSFFHHVAFDQLVTPRTRYLDRATVERWLGSPAVDQASSYVIFRNGNSWKFGGRKK
ncbi:MAG TPA: class I SAM-dependent methyltransferase [Thermoanaerobaculia bacterium]|nr:class I SAM-dependent methyltransferase [Thermoanaerobaculia bacterium]